MVDFIDFFPAESLTLIGAIHRLVQIRIYLAVYFVCRVFELREKVVDLFLCFGSLVSVGSH